MLWLVGTGISGIKSIPSDGAEAMSDADIIYVEQFTSPVPSPASSSSPSDDIENESHEIIKAIQNMARKDCIIKEAKRWKVEDGREILKNAESQNTVLLSYGDPLVATTHADLLCRATSAGIKTGIVHASSAPFATIGECGLHHYKMGRMATIMRDQTSMITPYYIIYRNAIERCHTLLLLEYDHEGNEKGDRQRFVLEPDDALSGLLRTEEGQQRKIIHNDTFAIIASRIGLEDQRITAGKISNLVAIGERNGFGRPPHSIIIPGSLHFTEYDAINLLAECVDPPPQDDTTHEGGNEGKRNPNVPARIADQMVAKYAPMIRRSIEDVEKHCKGNEIMEGILENARLYVDDAEDFVKKDGHGDVAVLSIGYADGLADALRLLKGLDTGDKVDVTDA